MNLLKKTGIIAAFTLCAIALVLLLGLKHSLQALRLSKQKSQALSTTN